MIPPLKNALLYFHTLEYLKSAQLWGRVWQRLYRPRVPSPKPLSLRSTESRFITCARAVSMLSPEEFVFLNERRRVEVTGDWNSTDCSMLWLYNLHYFDDLVSSGSEQRFDWHRNLIARWVQENPPVMGVAWQPYPTSLRLVNWIKFHLNSEGLDGEAQRSLAMQARVLRKRLEYHLLGNHLWANAKALVFAGCFFEGSEAATWRAKGLALLQRELAEQVLADGGHFERSPMYQAIVVEDLLDLIQLARVYPSVISADFIDHWQQVVRGMLAWLKNMCHPDGDISFFNDATFGIAPSLASLQHYASLLALETMCPMSTSILMASSGYARLQRDDAVVLADVGEIGPDYLPGHAHADTLSFELSLFGHRVLVNQGIDRYGTDKERVRQRGTAAQNTVQVDGDNSSEVWGGFRVARRARPFDREWQDSTAQLRLRCSHDGYHRLKGCVTHTRAWDLYSQGLIVTDELSGRWQDAVAFFHFHPNVEMLSSTNTSCEFKVSGRRIKMSVENGSISVKQGQYHPGFGLTHPCISLEVNFSADILTTHFEWNI